MFQSPQPSASQSSRPSAPQLSQPSAAQPANPQSTQPTASQSTQSQAAPQLADDSNIDEIIKNMSNEEILRAFANGLLVEKGLSKVEPDVREQMVNDLLERINAFIDRAVLESLPAEKLEELDKMLDAGTATEEKIAELVRVSGVNTEEMITDALAKFHDIYLGNSKETGV